MLPMRRRASRQYSDDWNEHGGIGVSVNRRVADRHCPIRVDDGRIRRPQSSKYLLARRDPFLERRHF